MAKPRTLSPKGNLFLSKSLSRSTKPITLNIKENRRKDIKTYILVATSPDFEITI
jgi:hypothetical protein